MKMEVEHSEYENSVVLVTGGAGCIGSNLCSKIAELNAKKVILLDDLSAAYEWNIPKAKCIIFVKGSILDDEMLKRDIYIVNGRLVLLKYRSSGGTYWQFNFRMDDIDVLRKIFFNPRKKIFACLVCSEKTVCCLDGDELQQLLDLSKRSLQVITITIPKRGYSMHPTGYEGRRLNRAITHDCFPGKIFE